MRSGKWRVEPPAGFESVLGLAQEYSSLDEIMSNERYEAISSSYERYIEGVLSHLVQNKGYKFGGLIMEPMILGAGGMHFA